MGERRYPPLTPAEVAAIVEALGFRFKRQTRSHAHYEREADAVRPRRVVTVDMSMREFSERIIRSMIQQSRSSREDFYGANRRTARKIGLSMD